MIPTLLHVLPLPKEALAKALLPLMAVPVAPELAPYLVSSPTGVVWVPHASKQGEIRTAFRARELRSSEPPSLLEGEIVLAVLERSREERWGNVHPRTIEGEAGAREYLKTYGLTELELLAHPLTDVGHLKVDHRPVWMPLNLIAFVPKNRLYLGTLHVVSREQVAAVVHNPSRGMAFCLCTPA